MTEFPDATPAESSARPPYPPEFGSADNFLAAMTRSLGALCSYVDREGRFRYCNDHFAAWFGLAPAQLIGRSLREVYGEQRHAEFAPHLRRAFEGQFVHYERKAHRRDGTGYWISVSLAPHRDASGRIVGVFSSALEVDELKRATEERDQTLQELSFHMENSPLGVVEWTGDVVIKRWSQQAEHIFGWSAAETVGRRPTEVGLVHPDTLDTVRALTQELLQGQARQNRMLAKNFTKDGRVIHCEWYNSAFIGPDARTTSIFSLVQDVTLRIEAEAQLLQLAVHDVLTGLPNRQSLMARLDHAIARAKRSGETLALLFVDLDRFKPVNDTYGHAVGDELLVQIARSLKNCVRASDTVARLGGDEFVVLLETNVDAETPDVIGGRIRAALQAGFHVAGYDIESGASIGTALYPDHGNSADALLGAADARMYAAKRRDATSG